MITDETSYEFAVAMQPETPLEQSILRETFTRLAKLSEAPEHPDHLGTELVYYTLDLDQYGELDHGLWTSADIGVDENGQIDPDPGSRALIVIHDPGLYKKSLEEHDDEADDTTDVADRETEVAFSDVGDGDESESDGDVGGEESSDDETDVAEQEPAIGMAFELAQLKDPDYETMQQCAKNLQELGYEIPANQSADELHDDIQDITVRAAGE